MYYLNKLTRSLRYLIIFFVDTCLNVIRKKKLIRFFPSNTFEPFLYTKNSLKDMLCAMHFIFKSNLFLKLKSYVIQLNAVVYYYNIWFLMATRKFNLNFYMDFHADVLLYVTMYTYIVSDKLTVNEFYLN